MKVWRSSRVAQIHAVSARRLIPLIKVTNYSWLEQNDVISLLSLVAVKICGWRDLASLGDRAESHVQHKYGTCQRQQVMAQPHMMVEWRRQPTMGFCNESLALGWLCAHACGDELRCHHSREAAFSWVDMSASIQHPLPTREMTSRVCRLNYVMFTENSSR
jgi:hypothetical protein